MSAGFHMPTFAAAGAAFLLAVLWFDLMFDVQSRGNAGDRPPSEVLASISAYYRRVTTEAYPMNRLVALVMLLTLAAIVAEIVEGVHPWWTGWVSLALAGSGVVPTLRRTVPNARRLVAHRTPPKCSQLWHERSAAIICSASDARPLCWVSS